jgi:formylmethanofuran dehydrogenase subunit C
VTSLVLALKQEPDQRLDLAPLVPHRLEGKSEKEIAAIEIQTTKLKIRVGDIFDVKPGSAQSIRFDGGSARLDNIGQDSRSGEIFVDGPCGLGLGRGMSAGAITIRGDSGPFAGSAMSGGTLEIAGNAGDFLAAPRDGEMEGMTGGLLLVRGDVGIRAGDRLRRGTIVIEGKAGDHPGSRMIAGTLIVVGEVGALPGYLMRRGTIVLGSRTELAPTFVTCGQNGFGSYAALFSRLLRSTSETAADAFSRPLERFAGDMAALGKGEVLLPA